MPIAYQFMPRSAQPDRPVGIDLGNALTRGLVFLWNGAAPHYAVGRPGAPGAKIPAAQFVGTPLAKSIGPNGSTPAFAGAGGYKWAWSLPSSPNECTFFAWAASNSSAGTYSLIGCCDSAGGNPLFRLDYGGSAVFARLQLRGNSGTVLNLAAAVGEVAWTDDFIVGVYRSGTGLKEIWVNGVRYNTSTTDIGAITLNTTDVGVLSRSSPLQYLNGRMYLGGIYDRALTGREIQEISANPWQLFEPDPIQIYWASAGGATIIDLTSASFGFTGNAHQPESQLTLTTASNDFTANSIQPKTTVGLVAGALNFTANAITVGGQTIIDLGQAAFNFTANAVTLIKDTAIQLTTAAFKFVANAINISTPPVSGSGSGGGMFMALAGFFKKRRYRQKIGKNE